MSREFIETQNEQLIGRRIRCIFMNDKYPVPPRTEGTITHIDDIGTIHVKWDNGSTLGLVPREDQYELLDKRCTQPLYRECALFFNNRCVGCPMFK